MSILTSRASLTLVLSSFPRVWSKYSNAQWVSCAFYLFIRQPHGSEVSPAARNTLDSARIPRASKLLICGLFQKGRVLAQDALVPDDCKAHGPWPGRKHRH